MAVGTVTAVEIRLIAQGLITGHLAEMAAASCSLSMSMLDLAVLDTIPEGPNTDAFKSASARGSVILHPIAHVA